MTATTIEFQREKVIGVLEKAENLVDGHLIVAARSDNPGRCAIGELLFHAGVPTEDLLSAQEEGDDGIWKRYGDVLTQEYGLNEDLVEVIVEFNDLDYTTPRDRAQGVIEMVRRVDPSNPHQMLDADDPDSPYYEEPEDEYDW